MGQIFLSRLRLKSWVFFKKKSFVQDPHWIYQKKMHETTEFFKSCCQTPMGVVNRQHPSFEGSLIMIVQFIALILSLPWNTWTWCTIRFFALRLAYRSGPPIFKLYQETNQDLLSFRRKYMTSIFYALLLLISTPSFPNVLPDDFSWPIDHANMIPHMLTPSYWPYRSIKDYCDIIVYKLPF